MNNCILSSKARLYYQLYTKENGGMFITASGMGYDGSGNLVFATVTYCDTEGIRSDSYNIVNVKCKDTSGCGANTSSNGDPIYQAQLHRNGIFIYKWTPIGFDANGASIDSVEFGCADVDCNLADNEQYFDIEKLPFIQYISVEVGDSPNILNFYRISTLTSTGTPNKDLIKTIQSDDDCPEPEYRIECNPDDKCPPGTCECEINGKICCYDPITGVVIDEKEFGNGSSGSGGAGGGF